MADVEAYLKTVEERLEHLSAGSRLAITIGKSDDSRQCHHLRLGF